MEIEIEVTYLCSKLPENLKDSPSILLKDVYFPPEAAKPKLRIRQKGESYEITKKEQPDPNDASVQVEHTISLSAEEFNALEKSSARKVVKTRYYYSLNNLTFEVDVFEGEHKGLVLAEVEFKSSAEKALFKAPPFCLCDVTQENLIAGGILSGTSSKVLFDALSTRYRYAPI